MTTKIVLTGAGSAMFGFGALGDIFKSQILRGCTVTLLDINPEALARVEGIAREYLAENDLPYTLEATPSRQEALQGADFCIISIEVGNRYELWEQDWKIPLQYGIRQVYGENGGPGGLFHALRGKGRPCTGHAGRGAGGSHNPGYRASGHKRARTV